MSGRTPGKLGRKPYDPTRPNLKLRLPRSEAMTTVDWYSRVTEWPMFGNDRYGDCVWAGAGHQIEGWTTYAAGTEARVTDDQVLAAYSAVTGFDPATGANDNGTNMQTACDYLRKVGLAGHKILGFGELERDPATLHAALAAFGSVYIGIEVPDSAQSQFAAGQPWDVVPDAQIEGGHCVLIVGYDADTQEWLVVTWGAIQRVTQAFFDAYLEEAWALVTQDWIEANGNTPAGEAVAALGADFTRLTGQPSPFPQPAPVPADGVTKETVLQRVEDIAHELLDLIQRVL